MTTSAWIDLTGAMPFPRIAMLQRMNRGLAFERNGNITIEGKKIIILVLQSIINIFKVNKSYFINFFIIPIPYFAIIGI